MRLCFFDYRVKLWLQRFKSFDSPEIKSLANNSCKINAKMHSLYERHRISHPDSDQTRLRTYTSQTTKRTSYFCNGLTADRNKTNSEHIFYQDHFWGFIVDARAGQKRQLFMEIHVHLHVLFKTFATIICCLKTPCPFSWSYFHVQCTT